MTAKYCVFLRGVNVNGVKMKMDDLKKAFAGMSYAGAKTVLATGNVVISANCGESSVMKSDIENNLSGFFKYDAHVFLRTSEELEAVGAASRTMCVPPGCHLYYLICDDSSVISEISSVFASLPHQAGEAYIPNNYGAFWVVPVGETLDSAFGSKILGSRKYKDTLTSRNMNTIIKISQTMRE
jgi:uncharacterized protein (DUF1697 family)